MSLPAESLQNERDALQSLLDTLAEIAAENPEGQDTVQAAQREIATAFIRQWKLNRVLYEQYGGRIIYQQTGPEPLDAYRQFLETQQTQGHFQIFDARLAEAFWHYYRSDELHVFYPPDSDEAAQAFNPPW